MNSCLSIYLGKELYAMNLQHEDIWTKGCICPVCFDHVYLVERGLNKFISHCPRKEEYKIVCALRTESKNASAEAYKQANRQVHKTVERFHIFFRRILEAFLPKVDIYEHRQYCLDTGVDPRNLDFISEYWKSNLSLINKYILETINLTKEGKVESYIKEDNKLIRNLFNKAFKYQNQTLSILCVIKYLSQKRAKIHLESLFLYANYMTWINDKEGLGIYHRDNQTKNLNATYFTIMSIILFCPWMELSERIEKSLNTSDLFTD